MTTIDSRPASHTAGARGDAAMPGGSIPVARLTLVELRKLADTRAGFWLLLAIALAGIATSAVILLGAPSGEQNFRNLFALGLLPANVLLPVLGVLSMTAEWSQRTALATFTLVPSRARVIAAKLLACVLITLAAVAATAALCALANVLAAGTGGDASWSYSAGEVGKQLLNQVIFMLMGAGFGALLMSSPLAIVLYFALPTVWTVLGSMVSALQRAAGWLDLSVTSGPLTEQAALTSDQWARLGAAFALWVAVPLVAGTIRTLRREVS